MSGLKSFRTIPQDLREWTRWMQDQHLPTRGTGSPEGVVTGSPGDLYVNTAGGTSTTLYVKESGTDTTGWIAK